MKDSILNKKFKYTFSSAYIIIAAINVVVYFAINYLNIFIKGLPLQYWLSLLPIMVKMGYVWQFFTYMFVHSDPMHLLFNMYALVMFGASLERAVGSREFVLYYLLCGLLGGVICYFSYTFMGKYNVAIMGASGSIYALLFLTAVLFPTNRVLLFFFVPMKMALAVLVFIAIEVMDQVLGSADGISHLVHLSSIGIGYLYCVVRFRISPFKVFREALKRAN